MARKWRGTNLRVMEDGVASQTCQQSMADPGHGKGGAWPGRVARRSGGGSSQEWRVPEFESREWHVRPGDGQGGGKGGQAKEEW
jgi:hypothetical protein